MKRIENETWMNIFMRYLSAQPPYICSGRIEIEDGYVEESARLADRAYALIERLEEKEQEENEMNEYIEKMNKLSSDLVINIKNEDGLRDVIQSNYDFIYSVGASEILSYAGVSDVDLEEDNIYQDITDKINDILFSHKNQVIGAGLATILEMAGVSGIIDENGEEDEKED